MEILLPFLRVYESLGLSWENSNMSTVCKKIDDIFVKIKFYHLTAERFPW